MVATEVVLLCKIYIPDSSLINPWLPIRGTDDG